MTAASSGRGIRSSRRNPCPVCGRDADSDCELKPDGRVFCNHGSRFSPPSGLTKGDVIDGSDGVRWAYLGESDMGRSMFKPDEPLDRTFRPKVVDLRARLKPPAPAPITGPITLARLPKPLPAAPPDHFLQGHHIDYSPTQWTEWEDGTQLDKDGQIKSKGERPRHRKADGKTGYSKGPDPWPLFGAELLPHAQGQWIAAAEGPKCAQWLQAGGLVAVSQPGHDHADPSIRRRFQELKAAGIAGMVYLSDHDKPGRDKAEKLEQCAATAGFPFLHLPAADVWPGIPEKGSIDDAPGSPAERVAALEAAVQRAQQQPAAPPQEPGQILDALLGPAEEGKLRRPRKDLLVAALGAVLPLRYNLLTNRIEHRGEPIHGDFLGTLHLEIAEQHGLEVAKDRAADAAVLLARRSAYHPVRNYLLGLTQPLPADDWAALDLRCFGGEDPTGWGALHLQRQLIGLVARALDPGCDLQTCLVMQSDEQGIGKSRFWHTLGGEWFSDSLGDLRDVKEDRLQLHSAWIHEWGEIDNVMGKRESETLKRFLSCSRDDVRRPYGRGTEQLKRSCGIVGTTNRRDFIKDPTGNRRFPVISVRRVEISWVEDHRDAIWASALAAYRAGERWHYTREENAMVTAEASAFAAEDPLREAVETWLEDRAHLSELPVVHVLMGLGYSGDQLRDQGLRTKAGNAMRALGWTRTDGKRRYHLPDGSSTDKTYGWVRPA